MQLLDVCFQLINRVRLWVLKKTRVVEIVVLFKMFQLILSNTSAECSHKFSFKNNLILGHDPPVQTTNN